MQKDLSRGATSSRPKPELKPTSRTELKPVLKVESKVDTNLEHISDREDLAGREIQLRQSALSATTSPAVRRMSRGEGAKSPPKRQVSQQALDAGLEGLHNSKKFNSTSTLFVDGTVTQPNMEETLKCVALAINFIIQDGHQQANPLLFNDHFDEKRFPLTAEEVPDDYNIVIPTDEQIYHFISRIFVAAAMTSESAIITLVYVNRAIHYTGLALHASNWKRVLLGAILMSSKVWDDQAVWNVDFCNMFPHIDVEGMNDIERTFLEMLQFNINVESTTYTKYYFDLRTLAEKNDKAFPLEPLSREQAEKLEALSSKTQANIRRESLRNAKSLDLKAAFANPAILS